MTKELTNYVQIGDKNFPVEGSKEELEALGLRYLITPAFEVDGTERRIEYLAYQDDTHLAIWRNVNDKEIFEIHTEAKITKRH